MLPNHPHSFSVKEEVDHIQEDFKRGHGREAVSSSADWKTGTFWAEKSWQHARSNRGQIAHTYVWGAHGTPPGLALAGLTHGPPNKSIQLRLSTKEGYSAHFPYFFVAERDVGPAFKSLTHMLHADSGTGLYRNPTTGVVISQAQWHAGYQLPEFERLGDRQLPSDNKAPRLRDGANAVLEFARLPSTDVALAALSPFCGDAILIVEDVPLPQRMEVKSHMSPSLWKQQEKRNDFDVLVLRDSKEHGAGQDNWIVVMRDDIAQITDGSIQKFQHGKSSDAIKRYVQGNWKPTAYENEQRLFETSCSDGDDSVVPHDLIGNDDEQIDLGETDLGVTDIGETDLEGTNRAECTVSESCNRLIGSMDVGGIIQPAPPGHPYCSFVYVPMESEEWQEYKERRDAREDDLPLSPFDPPLYRRPVILVSVVDAWLATPQAYWAARPSDGPCLFYVQEGDIVRYQQQQDSLYVVLYRFAGGDAHDNETTVVHGTSFFKIATLNQPSKEDGFWRVRSSKRTSKIDGLDGQDPTDLLTFCRQLVAKGEELLKFVNQELGGIDNIRLPQGDEPNDSSSFHRQRQQISDKFPYATLYSWVAQGAIDHGCKFQDL